MNIKLQTGAPLKQKTACLVLGACEKGLSDPLLKELDGRLGGLVRQAQRSGEFTGKPGEHILFQPAGGLPAERVLLVGLGPRGKVNLDHLRQAAGTAMQQVAKKKAASLTVALALVPVKGSDPAARIAAVTEGLLLAGYRYDRYLGKQAKEAVELPKATTLLVARSGDKAPGEAALERASKLVRAVSLARDLVNAPGNLKSPEYLADQARAAAGASGLACTVLGTDELSRDGFGALLGVAQGSLREPRLITLEHHGGKPGEAPVVLVGKGVVFDAGGISLKPAEKMDEMKMDMAGGAAVIGTLMAAALLQLPVNLVGIVPAVENMPSGSAYRPGDILTSLSGQTIEVLNTDAEGRLILADALTYAKSFKPRLVIDLATLTGACIIALGHQASAVLGNDDKLIDELRAAGEACGERLWPLPLWDDYDQQIKSDVADMKNTGGRPAGTITAAAFLKKFAGDFRWAHLDIAGTAWLDQGRPCIPKGGTGVGVRLLVTFLQAMAGK